MRSNNFDGSETENPARVEPTSDHGTGGASVPDCATQRRRLLGRIPPSLKQQATKTAVTITKTIHESATAPTIPATATLPQK